MPNPFKYAASYAAPGGKVNWARIMFMGLVLALFLLLLFYISKPILEFFGIGGNNGNTSQETAEATLDGLNEPPPLPPGSPANTAQYSDNYDYLLGYVNDLIYVINKTYWFGSGAEERCQKFKQCVNDLDDNELARVANSYYKVTGNVLAHILKDLSFHGCTNDLFSSSDDARRYDLELINRLNAIQAGA